VDLEFEMPSEGSWIGISFYEGIIVEVPDASPVGKPGRGEPHRAETMHNFLIETFNLRCEQLRAKVVVKACGPADRPPDCATGPESVTMRGFARALGPGDSLLHRRCRTGS
jgi:hypothetical protein